MKKTLLIAAIVLGACAAPGADDATIGVDVTTTTASRNVTQTASDANETDSADSAQGVSTTTVTNGSDLGGDDVSEQGEQRSTTTTRPAQDPPGDSVPDQTAPISVGEVPADVMEMVYAAAEAHTGLDRSAMAVIRAESVTWPDGSLGCPEPGMTYTMATVDGYWIELSAGDTTLDYRVGSKGALKLCESGLGISPPNQDS